MNAAPLSSPLPPQLARGASLHGSEYGWELGAFPGALRNAPALGFACLGGQFQFRIDDGVCEMYWLSADSDDRHDGEPWSDYCYRSCAEVSERFNAIIAKADFRAEAANWTELSRRISEGFDPHKPLVFAAYFVTEQETEQLTKA